LRDGGDALKALSEFEYFAQSLTQLCIFSILLAGFFALKKISFGKRLLVSVSAVVAILGLASLGFVASKYDDLERRNLFSLSPYMLSPVHAFFYSSRNYEVAKRDGWDRFKLYNRPVDKVSVVAAPKKYNIIVITMESFRASFVGEYGSALDITPNFDELAKKSIIFKNFYANSNFTIKGENAILCGFFDHNAKISVAEYDFEKELSCLPEVLGGLGYETFYFHANHSKFYNRDGYFPNIGFDELNFYADMLDKGEVRNKEVIGWGISDVAMFEYFYEHITKRESERPFFANIMTISAHYPFRYDWPIPVPNENAYLDRGDGSIYRNYENAIHYSDYALGQFLQAFEESGLSSNTILVVTGDHGVWVFDDDEKHSVKKEEEFFKVPMLIYHPDVRGKHLISQISSQVDVMPTVLGLIGEELPLGSHIGKDALSYVEKPWAVMMKGGDISIRMENKHCLAERRGCNKVYQSCLTMSSIGVASYKSSYQCYSTKDKDVVGGLLGSDDSLIDSAFNMIAFENKAIIASESKGRSISQNPRHPSLKEFFADKPALGVLKAP
jgi:phosphoglycerol transferase MdoB-like AlkP superfamily enzyme